MKSSSLSKDSLLWVLPLIASFLLIFFAVKCSKVDDGAYINPTHFFVYEEAINDTATIDGTQYLYYQGNEYEVPQDKKISLGQSLIEQENDGWKSITKSIFFDETRERFVYKEEILTTSYKIMALKEETVHHYAKSYFQSRIMWFFGIVFAAISTIIFLFFWLPDLIKACKLAKQQRMRNGIQGSGPVSWSAFCLHSPQKNLWSI